MIVVDDPLLSHERYALVTVHPSIPDHHKRMVLGDVVRIMTEDFALVVPELFVYPIGVRIVAFEDVMIHDQYTRIS